MEGIRHIEIPKCSEPGCDNPGVFFCDYEAGPFKTCDKPLCSQHRHYMGGKDYCREHAEMVMRAGVKA